MSIYDQILVATDAANTHEEKCVVIDTAKDWADSAHADLKILHTVSPLGESGIENTLPSMLEIEEDILHEAEDEINQIAEDSGIDFPKPCISVGRLEDEVLKEKEVDLIVVNNDNDHYWGSLAESIMQRAKCDILAVKS